MRVTTTRGRAGYCTAARRVGLGSKARCKGKRRVAAEGNRLRVGSPPPALVSKGFAWW